MITYQKHQMTPEFRRPEIIDTPLAVAHEKHWNIVNDLMFPACLEDFKARHEASKRTTSQTGPSARGTTLTKGPSSVVGSGPQSAPTSDAEEVREQVQEIMAQIFALRVQTVQEVGLVQETDRALSRALMAEFIRLHLIVGEDLNTSLQAMQTEMETISNELIRDLDIASRNTVGDPSGNPSVKVALNHFRELVRLKLSLPLAQLDAAREDMDRFLHHRLSQLDAQQELKSLLGSLTERMAAHQCRIGEIIQSEALKNSEVSQRVMVGVRAEQPLESNFFPGVLEGLLGSLGINATGGKNPPTSSKEGVARMWASAVQKAVHKMEGRDVTSETTSGETRGLHLDYEEDFLQRRSSQVSRIFLDPKFLPVYQCMSWPYLPPQRKQHPHKLYQRSLLP